MNFLDFILLIPILWFAYKGFSKGFIMEVFSLTALVMGIYACIHFADYTKSWLQDTFDDSWATAMIFVYLVTFVTMFAGVFFFGKLLEKIITIGPLSFVNKLSGATFGILKAFLLVGAIFLAITQIGGKKITESQTVQGSGLIKPVVWISQNILPAIGDHGLFDSFSS